MVPGHRMLAIVWAALAATFVAGTVSRFVPLTVLPFFGVIAVAVYTYRAVDKHAGLRHRWLYFTLVGSLLLSAAATVVGAGMTVAIERGSRDVPMLGLVTLGSTNVVIAALAWRALVRPSTRAAAGAGMVAVTLEIVATVIDGMINVRAMSYGEQELGFAIALTAAMISIGTGALACFAALLAFESKRVEVPEARVVDPP